MANGYFTIPDTYGIWSFVYQCRCEKCPLAVFMGPKFNGKFAEKAPLRADFVESAPTDGFIRFSRT